MYYLLVFYDFYVETPLHIKLTWPVDLRSDDWVMCYLTSL